MTRSKRAAILETATWLFATKGFRETSTTEVARLTESAEGTVFYHFESKEKLFLAVLADARDRIDRGFEDFLPGTETMSGLEMFETIVAFYLQLAGHNKAQFMLLHRRYAYDLAKVNEECRAILEEIFDRVVKVIEVSIHQGQEDKSMGRVPVRKTALLVYMMIDGLVRLENYNLYEAGALLGDFLDGCRRLVKAQGAVVSECRS